MPDDGMEKVQMTCVMSKAMTTTLEKEIDLVNGRIDKDQYDMTGRLVQSATLEKIPGVSRPWQTLIQCNT